MLWFKEAPFRSTITYIYFCCFNIGMSIEHVFFEHVAACQTVSKYNQGDRRKGMNKNPTAQPAPFWTLFIQSLYGSAVL